MPSDPNVDWDRYIQEAEAVEKSFKSTVEANSTLDKDETKDLSSIKEACKILNKRYEDDEDDEEDEEGEGDGQDGKACATIVYPLVKSSASKFVRTQAHLIIASLSGSINNIWHVKEAFKVFKALQRDAPEIRSWPNRIKDAEGLLATLPPEAVNLHDQNLTEEEESSLLSNATLLKSRGGEAGAVDITRE
jgi:hypothetical protein